MPSRSSFDLIWRSLEEEFEELAEHGLDVGEHALWMEFFQGDRRYETQVSTGPGISCQIQLSQSVTDAAADFEALADDEAQFRGHSWLSVEFCVNGPASEPVDASLLQRVIEEFWPDVDIYHETVVETARDEDGHFPLGVSFREELQHNHFRFSWVVGYSFVQRVPQFADALIETMRRLSATVPPGRMI